MLIPLETHGTILCDLCLPGSVVVNIDYCVMYCLCVLCWTIKSLQKIKCCFRHEGYYGIRLDPIIVAHYQGHKPIHWKIRRAGNDNIYTGLTQYTVTVIENQREVRYFHPIFFHTPHFWHPTPPFKTHTWIKHSPPCCSSPCHTTKTNMAPI